MHSALAAVLGALTLVSCGSAEQPEPQQNSVASVDEPLHAEAPASTDDAAEIGKAIDASIDGGVSDNAKLLFAKADLNGDGTDEALGYLIDPMMCGTGGCGLYILSRTGAGWSIESTIGPSQLPVYRLSTATGGWTDLGVSISGGGANSAVMRVPHAASGYARNPTVAPATQVKTDGEAILIADDYEKAVPINKDAQAQ